HIHTSLLPFITSTQCVPDNLHLMLRIVDILIECFFFELMYDPIAFDNRPTNSISIREKVEYIMKLIGITCFKFFPPAKKTKTTKWTWCTLMGPSKLKIVEKFP
ncbi:35157_t:CDS:1, partial [Racocetra persica]